MLTPAAEARSGRGAGGPAPAHVTVRGLCKRFGATTIYHDFDLDIPRGRLVSVFGPNGCGKSTLINMIAGLIPLDAGEILFDGKPLSQIKFGYVFQNYREALFPWLRSLENIEYPLKLMGVPKAERRARVERLVARHEEFGKSPAAARAWVATVDEPNAQLVDAAAHRADLVVDLTGWEGLPDSPAGW